MHGEFWAAHLRAQAQRADQLVVASPPDRVTATALLAVDPERIVTIPNGVDLDRFRPRSLTLDERRACFRRWLVEEPQGWNEGGASGTVAYGDDDLVRLLGVDGDAVVLLYVGRFTSAKRVPILIRAFAQARARFERPASLVVWGGSPGEFEDEHPVTVATQVGADGIYFAGWRGHDDLPDGLAASDAFVMASVNDSYPQAPLEAMAVGLPVIATTSGGFPSMINLDPARLTGWLVAPDDVDALSDALVDAVNRPAERRRRGQHALAHARARFSWNDLMPRFEDAYAAAIARHAAGREQLAPNVPMGATRGGSLADLRTPCRIQPLHEPAMARPPYTKPEAGAPASMPLTRIARRHPADRAVQNGRGRRCRSYPRTPGRGRNIPAATTPVLAVPNPEQIARSGAAMRAQIGRYVSRECRPRRVVPSRTWLLHVSRCPVRDVDGRHR